MYATTVLLIAVRHSGKRTLPTYRASKSYLVTIPGDVLVWCPLREESTCICSCNVWVQFLREYSQVQEPRQLELEGEATEAPTEGKIFFTRYYADVAAHRAYHIVIELWSQHEIIMKTRLGHVLRLTSSRMRTSIPRLLLSSSWFLDRGWRTIRTLRSTCTCTCYPRLDFPWWEPTTWVVSQKEYKWSWQAIMITLNSNPAEAKPPRLTIC